ncbi:2'-5' RNA ligase family protein [Agromyces sp. SYSU K20354]|uniref:2'-5' RNA ligase family protein n=1 Tax=Agromyces cavernae TaxID=2898659 RepID=UPI001E2EF787|nr:2'-5' RNA ligase family protein [Agromyces cavernae]MCD2444170.1 2'-5' RNA ligase family protein [Agromyces cavernae]
MARFVVVLPLVPLAAGDEFTVADWPLHVTLVEPFSTEHPTGLVADAVRTATTGAAVVRATAGEEAMFGRHRDVPVTLVRDGGELAALRRRTLDALHRAGIDTGHPRAEFRPHVTRKRHGRLHTGERVTLGSVALIDMRPPEGSHHRRVIAAMQLSGASGPASAPPR